MMSQSPQSKSRYRITNWKQYNTALSWLGNECPVGGITPQPSLTISRNT